MELYTYSQTKWNTPCSDDFFWKIIHDFCWGNVDCLSWEDFYNQLNAKIVNFSYSENVMNMLYEFITEKTDLLYSRLFPDFIESQNCNPFAVIDGTTEGGGRKATTTEGGGRKATTTEGGANFVDNIDFVLIRSILEEIVSLGKEQYETATVDLVYNMYIYDKYSIPGGLCSLFTTFNNTKILRCEHIPNMTDFFCVSSDSEEETE